MILDNVRLSQGKAVRQTIRGEKRATSRRTSPLTRNTASGATHAFNRRPLSSASRPFIRPIWKGSKGSILPGHHAVGEWPLFAHLRRLSMSRIDELCSLMGHMWTAPWQAFLFRR